MCVYRTHRGAGSYVCVRDMQRDEGPFCQQDAPQSPAHCPQRGHPCLCVRVHLLSATCCIRSGRATGTNETQFRLPGIRKPVG